MRGARRGGGAEGGDGSGGDGDGGAAAGVVPVTWADVQFVVLSDGV